MEIFPDPLPYPWSPDGKLCPLLREGDVWCEVFSENDLRKPVKRACKNLDYPDQLLNTDDASFGRAAVWLLDRPKGRAELQRQLKQCRMTEEMGALPGRAGRQGQRRIVRIMSVDLPSLVYKIFYLGYEEFRTLFPSNPVCVRDVLGRPFLDPARFGKQVANTPAAGENLRLLALFACSFAMLEPAKGKAILAALVENCPECRRLVLPALSAAPEPAEFPVVESGLPFSADPEQEAEAPLTEDWALPSDAELWTSAELERCGDALKSFQAAHSGLREWLKRLPSDIDNLPLADDPEAESPAEHFGDILEDLRASGREAKAWLDCLDRSLTAGSARDSRGALPLLETLHGHTSQAHGTLDLLRNAGAEAVELLRQIAGELSAMNERHARDLKEIYRLEAELDVDEWAAPHPVPTDHLLHALTLLPVMAERVTKRREEFTDWLASRRHELQQELDFQLENYNLAALEPETVERIETFRANLAALATRNGWEALRQAMIALERELAESPQARSVADLAREALDATPKNLVPLAQALLTKNRAAEALTLLTLWQLSEEAEMTDLGDFSALIDTLVAAAVQLDAAGALPFAWTDALFQQPWVRGLRRSDIESVATARRLAVAMVAQEHVRGTQAEIGLFYQLDCASALAHDAYPALSRMLAGIAVSHPPRIVAALPVLREDEMAARIENFFKPDHHTGGYLEQAAKRAGAFHGMECDHLFPKLSEVWLKVRAHCGEGDWLAARKAAELDAEDILHRACQQAGIGETTSAFYYRQVVPHQTGYIPDLEKKLNDYVVACEKSAGVAHDEDLVTTDALAAELRRMAEGDPAGAPFWEAAERTLTQSPPVAHGAQVSSGGELLADLCHVSGKVAAFCPEVVAELCCQAAVARLEPEILRPILVRLVHEADESALPVLNSGQCFRHALLVLDAQIAEKSGTPDAHESNARDEARRQIAGQRTECEEKLRGRWQAVSGHALTSLDERTWAFALERGYYAFLDKQIGAAESNIANAKQERRGADLAWLGLQIRELEPIKDAAELQREGKDWMDGILKSCSQLEDALRQARRQVANENKTLPFSREVVSNALDALQFLAKEGLRDFTEVENNLRQLAPAASDEQGKEESLPVVHGELMRLWTLLAGAETTTRPAVQQLWEDFVKAFSKVCRLYYQIGFNMRSAALENYHWPRFETRFTEPRNRWLDREIHLYLCFGERSLAVELNRLSERIENSPSHSLNVVFVPNGLGRYATAWNYDPKRSGYVLADQSLLTDICSRSKKAYVPLRQALHRSSQNFARMGLFKSVGYVHEKNDIFVGRKEALWQLANQPASAIWGGRRTGKTSLMHALRTRLLDPRDRPEPYRVVLVYATSRELGEGDPDMIVARKIATGLKFTENFQSIAEFEDLLQKACDRDRIAILIDEADTYINASRTAHGDAGFPLARTLRGITQTDSDQRFKLVYAGFKELYYEVQMRETSEVSYPFKQVIRPVHSDFRNLEPREIEELMTIGFVETLGAELDPSVPQLVRRKTSGHPAFVQRFCEGLLGVLSSRNNDSPVLQVTANDVEEVYEDARWNNDNSSGGASFLAYVSETLTWNISHLGRAILLTLSVEIRADKDPEDRAFTAAQILHKLEFWCQGDVRPPDKHDFDNTLELLTMTGMLSEEGRIEDRRYKITYGAYIDFWNRIELVRNIEIQQSLRDYHAKDKGAVPTR